MVKNNWLFSEIDWFSVEAHRRKEAEKEVADMDGNRLLNSSVNDLCGYLVEKYRIDVPILNRDGIHVDQHETQIDVSRDPMRAISNRSQPYYIPGTAIEITVPFIGDAEIFRFRLPAYELNPSPPRGNVKGMTITFFITGADLVPNDVRREIDNTVDRIDSHLTCLRGKVEIFNNKLDSIVRRFIEQRREKLLANQNLVESLGFPLKERNESPRT